MNVGEMRKGLMIECITKDCVHPHVSYYDHETTVQKWNTRVNDPLSS